MYREPAPPVDAAPPPRELRCVSVDRSRRGNSATATFKLFAVPVVATMATLAVATPELALVALIGSSIGSVVWWRRAPLAGAVVLRVDEGELRVLARDGRHEVLRAPLTEVDVELDSATEERMQEGSALVADLRFVHATVGPGVETARVVVVAPGRRAALTEERVPHMDAAEQYGKIRVFLRKHGWLPRDERAGAIDEDDDEDEGDEDEVA